MTSRRKSGDHPVLAKPGDPMVAPNGRLIQPVKKAKTERKANEERLSSENFKPSKQRNLNDLPGTPQILSGCAVVFLYTVLGVGDRDIAKAAGITAEQVRVIRTHPAYAECFDLISQEFINANSGLLASRIAGYQHMALDTVAEIAEEGRQESNRLRAGIDLMAMGGHGGSRKSGPGGNGREGDELRIVILEGSEKTVKVELNGEAFGEVEDA